MKYDKVTILGVIACALLFFAILWLQRPQLTPPQTTASTITTAEQPAVQPPVKEVSATVAEDTQTVLNVEDDVQTAAPAETETPSPAQSRQSFFGPGKGRAASTAERKTLIKDGEMVCYIDPERGGVTSIELMKYAKHKKADGEEQSPVELGHFDYPFLSLSDVQADELGLEKAGDVTADERSVTLVRKSASGELKVTESWTLSDSTRYGIDYAVTIENLGASSIEMSGLMIEGGAVPPSVSGRQEDGGGAACMPVGEKHCTMFSPKDLQKVAQAYGIVHDPHALTGDKDKALEKIHRILPPQVSWVSVHSKYFLLALWNKDTAQPSRCDAFVCEPLPEGTSGKEQPRYRAKLELNGATVAPGQSVQWNVCGYAGPKDPDVLYHINNGLDGILGLDRFFWRASWMAWLSRILLKCLVWLSRLFPEGSAYGWAVILLTVAVKVLFWPLSYKATVSMRKMQELKPQIDALKERYGDNPQLMYRKQQELMKANGVNQFGGCLPMLLQIPVFFALYNTFRSAIDLRLAGFLWVDDLSMPDAICQIGNIGVHPLAILMGITMILQQKMTPNADPQQGRMMMIMSVVFTYIFYNFPSALTLYMTVNQLLSALQTYMIKRVDTTKSQNTAPKKA